MPGKQPRIALLFDFLYDKYQLTIWSGVVKAARDFGFNLYCFPGGQLLDPFPNSVERNLLFDMALHSRMDGFLILSSVLGNYSSEKIFAGFYKAYSGIPNVSIGVKIKRCPSLLVDNAKGMSDLVSHFVEAHGFTQIAYIKGPEENLEARVRYQAYLDTLAKYNIDFHPEMVSPGLHYLGSGEAALDLFFKKRKIKCQVIVADNDLTAIDVLQTCKTRGIRVPDDIAVSGFDDIRESRLIKPQLTTVHQPLKKLGYEAARLLKVQLEGNSPPLLTLLPTQMRIRRSCGCNNKISPYSFPLTAGKKNKPSTGVLRVKQEKIEQEIRKISADLFLQTNGSTLPEDWIVMLTRAFFKAVGDADPEIFLRVFQDIVTKIESDNIDIFGWYQVLSVLFNQMNDILDEPRSIIEILKICIRVTETLWEIEAGSEAEYIDQADRLFKQVSWVGQELIAAFNTQKLTESIGQVLPNLGIKRFYITEYTNPAGSVESSRFLQAVEDGIPRHDLLQMKKFDTNAAISLCSRAETRYECLITIPLFIQQEHLGLFIFEHGNLQGTIYENLAIQLSNALKSAKIVDRLIQQTESLAASNTEKETLLKEVHHRVKNNLQVISSLLHLQCRHEGDRKIAAQFQAVQNRIKSMALIHEQLYKSKNLTRLNLKNYFHELIKNLKVSYSIYRDILINIASEDIHITIEKAIPLGLVVNELVSNALKHAFPTQQHGVTPTIDICCTLENNDNICLSVHDNGKGFPKKFNLRNTPSLGMQLIYNIIENQLNGSMKLTGKQGSRFDICIPL